MFNDIILRRILNSSFKKCRLTKSYYPIGLMIKFYKGYDSNNDVVYIPDSMYLKVYIYSFLRNMMKNIMCIAIKKFWII
jgi:hypothetical protein